MSKESQYLPRKLPRQARSKASFAAILDSAARVLVDEGYRHATTNRIANVAGVGIGTLYEYFPGKEAIFAALKARLNAEGYAMLVAQSDRSESQSLGDVFGAVIQARIDVVRANPALHRCLHDEVPHYVTQDQTDTILSGFHSLACAFLETHDEAVNEGPRDVMADLAMRTTHTLVENLVTFEPEKLEDDVYIDQFKTMICRYLLKEPI